MVIMLISFEKSP